MKDIKLLGENLLKIEFLHGLKVLPSKLLTTRKGRSSIQQLTQVIVGHQVIM